MTSARTTDKATEKASDKVGREAPLVSIVVPVKNGMPHVERVLAALATQELDAPFEVIVIDSGSTDASLERARAAEAAMEGRVRVVEIDPSTFGHGRTRNLGAAMSQAPFVAFLTHDAMPADDMWLANLLAPMREDERVAGVFSRHIAYAEHGPYAALELEQHFRGLAEFPVCEMTDARAYARNEGLRKVYHFYSDNASCLRRSVWEVHPYPDIDFAEDQIWAKTIIEAGWRKAFAADSVVYHSHAYSPFELFRRSYDEARALKELFGYDYLTTRRGVLRNWYAATRNDWRAGRARGWLRRHPGAMAARPALNLAKMVGLYLGTQNPDFVRRREHLVSRDRALRALRRDAEKLGDAAELDVPEAAAKRTPAGPVTPPATRPAKPAARRTGVARAG